jgi:hypothetical protein
MKCKSSDSLEKFLDTSIVVMMAPWKEKTARVSDGESYRRGYLQLPPGVELLQAVDGLLAMHHGSNALSLLQWEEGVMQGSERQQLTQIHGCLSASEAVMRLLGLTVSMLSMRFLASGVTVSHSGDGYFTNQQSVSE